MIRGSMTHGRKETSILRARVRSGVTILEIMIAMSLMSVVIIAFAATFPSGFRLNYASHTQTRGTAAANALAEQLANTPTETLNQYAADASPSPTPAPLSIASLNALVTYPPGGVTITATPPTSPNTFWVDDQGVTVARVLSPAANNPFTNKNDDVAKSMSAFEITVTVRWFEYRKGTALSGQTQGGGGTKRLDRYATVRMLSSSAVAR